MTRLLNVLVLLVGLCALGAPAPAAPFDCGSDGHHGALIATATSQTVTLDVPPDGQFHWTQVQIASGAIIKFRRNALNTPVYFLSQGDVEIAGRIDVSGVAGTSNPPVGGAGGPGGFDGGAPGIQGALPPGDGHGPGAGKGGTAENPSNVAAAAGAAAYGGPSYVQYGKNQAMLGATYGSALLVPLTGGSGGGGAVITAQGQLPLGGGGGGGAILIASNTRVHIPSSGRVDSVGGANSVYPGTSGQGSGGAIRIVAPVVTGSGTLDANGGFNSPYSSFGGNGRIRVDTQDRTNMALIFSPLSAGTVGAFMTVFPPGNPKLNIIEAAGTTIPEGQPSPVQVLLPVDSPTTQTVRVQARGFKGTVPIRVSLVPEAGSALYYNAEIQMTSDPAEVTVATQMPKNTVVYVYAWTR